MKINKASIFSFVSAILIVILIMFKILAMNLGNNPLNTTRYGYISYTSLLPEGWAFFTKNSREPVIHLYKYSEENIRLVNLRNLSGEFYFGLSRHNRILNIQLGNILSTILEDSINGFELNAYDENELGKIFKKYKYNDISYNKSQLPNFNGKYIVAIQQLLPWSLIYKKPNYKSTFIVYPINIVKE